MIIVLSAGEPMKLRSGGIVEIPDRRASPHRFEIEDVRQDFLLGPDLGNEGSEELAGVYSGHTTPFQSVGSSR